MDYPVYLPDGDVVTEDSQGGLALQMGNGPCLPCAGRKRIVHPGGGVEERWTDDFGLREDIPLDLPSSSLDDMFPVALPADLVTQLWWLASSITVTIDLSWRVWGVRYSGATSAGATWLRQSPDLMHELTAHESRTVPLTRSNFRAPPTLLAYPGLAPWPASSWGLVSDASACLFDYAAVSNLLPFKLPGRERSFCGVPLVGDPYADAWSPQFAFMCDSMSVTEQNMYGLSHVEYAELRLNNFRENTRTVLSHDYTKRIPATFSFMGHSTSHGHLRLHWSSWPYSTDGSIPPQIPVSFSYPDGVPWIPVGDASMRFTGSKVYKPRAYFTSDLACDCTISIS